MLVSTFNNIINNEINNNIYDDIAFILLPDGVKLVPNNYKPASLINPETTIPESQQSKIEIDSDNGIIKCYSDGILEVIYDISQVIGIIFKREAINKKDPTTGKIETKFDLQNIYGVI